jgi:hypothetical protein
MLKLKMFFYFEKEAIKAFEEYNKAKDDKIVYMSIISSVLSLIVKMANI